LASILVVEDNIENMELVVHLLEVQGHKSVVAMDGEAALNLLNTHTFNLILLDIRLPKIDGFEVLRKLKETINSNTPVVAITACFLKENEVNFIMERCVHYLVKPFLMNQFHKIVSTYV